MLIALKNHFAGTSYLKRTFKLFQLSFIKKLNDVLNDSGLACVIRVSLLADCLSVIY